MEGGSPILGFVILAMLVALYFIPTIVAKVRNHPNTTAIAILNVLLGWTLLGWVAAMVWACTATPSRQVVAVSADSLTAPNTDTRDCPFCAEPIKVAAVKCKHCGSNVPPMRKRARIVSSGWTLRVPCSDFLEMKKTEQFALDAGLPLLKADGNTAICGFFESEQEALEKSKLLGSDRRQEIQVSFVPD